MWWTSTFFTLIHCVFAFFGDYFLDQRLLSLNPNFLILMIHVFFLFFQHVDDFKTYLFHSLCIWFAFGYYFSQPTLLFLLQIPSLLLYMIRPFYTFLIFESCFYLSVLFCFFDMWITLILTPLIQCASGFLSNTMIIASLLRFDRRFFNFIHFCFLRIKIYTFFARLDVYILLQSVFPCIINRNNYDLRD